jgi:hypothetical protein
MTDGEPGEEGEVPVGTTNRRELLAALGALGAAGLAGCFGGDDGSTPTRSSTSTDSPTSTDAPTASSTENGMPTDTDVTTAPATDATAPESPTSTDTATPEASSVSQYGITWGFDTDRPVGQYANGDWWVNGPVTLTRITPESTEVDGRVVHGTMIDPVGGTQGFDSYDSDMDYVPDLYVLDLNVDPGATGEPLTVEEGSVVSSISLDSPDDNGRPVLSDLAILTVVDEQPPADAFRPGPYSDDKSAQWTESDLDYGVLRSLSVPDSAPDLGTVTESVEWFWNEQNTGWTARPVHAANNQPNYGREIAYTLGDALLSLHLDYSEEEKRDLFVNVVQRGIDIYDRASEGGIWKGNGGHNHGRKMPMLLAGLALDDQNILGMADADKNLTFQEDRTTFFVSEADVGREMEGDRETYREKDLGMPEWGAKHTRQPSRDDRRWGAQYRWVGSGFMHHALAAHLTDGAVEAWNHPPFFAYLDRYVRKGSPSSNKKNEIQPLARDFWEEYRSEGAGEALHTEQR